MLLAVETQIVKVPCFCLYSVLGVTFLAPDTGFVAILHKAREDMRPRADETTLDK